MSQARHAASVRPHIFSSLSSRFRRRLTWRCHRDSLRRLRGGHCMANLRLTFACGPYDRTQALRDGTLQPEGIELTYLPLQPAEIFWRMLQYKEFDASEMSLSNYTTLVNAGNSPFIAI